MNTNSYLNVCMSQNKYIHNVFTTMNNTLESQMKSIGIIGLAIFFLNIILIILASTINDTITILIIFNNIMLILLYFKVISLTNKKLKEIIDKNLPKID